MKRFAAWVIAGASIAILMTGCQGGPGMPGQPSDIRIVGDFEQSTDGWEPANTAKAEIADLHATSGAKALKVDLPVGPYPGIGIEFKKPADWSACQALRFSVFNASKDTFTLCVRVDDAASKDFGTRYNGDMYPFKLAPGANEVGHHGRPEGRQLPRARPGYEQDQARPLLRHGQAANDAVLR